MRGRLGVGSGTTMRTGGGKVSERLGFVGLGIMGQAMALRLVQHHGMAVHNRTPERARPLREAGARWMDSPRDVADVSSMVFLMLSNDAALEAVVEGPAGVLEGVRPGTLIVDHSTVSPALTRRLADAARKRGADWCDAPVTGGDIGAREATLTIMVGGTPESYRRVRPFLEQMGRRIVHVGAVGQGQTLKLVANMVSAMTLMASSEGVRMGLELGLSLEALDTVMTYGSAQSYELTKVLDRLTHNHYDPGFSVENRYKDLRLAVDLAEASGFRADLAQAAEALYRDHLQAGTGDRDETSYIQRWGGR